MFVFTATAAVLRDHSRYADVVVHRQLQVALDAAEPCYTSDAVSKQALQCNERNQAAKNAQVRYKKI